MAACSAEWNICVLVLMSLMQIVTVRGSNNDCVCVLFSLCLDLNVLGDVGMLSHCPWF